MARLKHALIVVAAAVSVPTVVSAFSFNIENTPQQCTNLSLSITGTGSPPYSALMIPFGSSPLPNNIEVRTIVEHNFTGTSTSMALNYPTDSQFVLLVCLRRLVGLSPCSQLSQVSDSTGFATGGTSAAATVQSSSDSSCFNASQEVMPEFFINVAPANQMIVQCQGIRIWWDPTNITQ